MEKLIAGIRRKIKNIYALAQDATDDDTITSLKGMLYESEEQEIKTRELNEAIDKFEAWAMGIGELLKDLAYVVDYDAKRLACKILGIKAQVWPVDADTTALVYGDRWFQSLPVNR